MSKLNCDTGSEPVWRAPPFAPARWLLTTVIALFAALLATFGFANAQDHSGAGASPGTSYHAPLVFTPKTGIAEGRMVYIGVGGSIEGKVNPELTVHEGELVQINLINGEGPAWKA